MFGRKKNAEGFYTGDAPASAPGFDGAEPTAYTGVPGAHQASAQPGTAQLPGQVLAQVPGFVDAPSGQQSAPPGQQSAPPGQQSAPPGPQVTTAGTLDPETAARVQAALAKPPKMGGLGLVILIPIVIAVLGGLVGIGVAIYAGAKATSAVSDVFSSIDLPTAVPAPDDPASAELSVDSPEDPARAGGPGSIVTGMYDEPALAEISQPEFTVTVGQPEVIKKKDARVVRAPETGRYLVFPVTFASVPGAEAPLDIVDADRFVLIPTGAAELAPAFAGVAGSMSIAAVSADEPATGLLAFDTRAKGGVLQLRDDAGDVMIEWSVGEAN